MYTVDPNIRDLQVKDKVITRLTYSMNAPQIATPELSTEEARCYILLFREGSSYSSYIGLYLPASDRRFYYAYSGNPLSEGGISEALDEATRFAEEMGFVLDELNLSALSVDERNKWVEDQPLFGGKKDVPAVPQQEPQAPQAAKGPEDDLSIPLPEAETEATPALPVPPVPAPEPAAAAAPRAAEAVEYKPPEAVEYEAPEPAAAEAPKAAEAVEYQAPEAVEYKAPEPAAAAAPKAAEAVEYKAPAAVEPRIRPMQARTAGTGAATEQQAGVQVPDDDAVLPSPRLKKRAAAMRQPAGPAKRAASAGASEQGEGEVSGDRPAAAVQAAAPQRPKGSSVLQPATGTVTKEYEALARLLASF